MTQPPELPPVSRAILTPDDLAALARDLTSVARVQQVVVKRGAGRADDRPVTLAEALDLLGRGEARGVQIRYEHDGALWIDSLLATPDGVRLVRVRHE